MTPPLVRKTKEGEGESHQDQDEDWIDKWLKALFLKQKEVKCINK